MKLDTRYFFIFLPFLLIIFFVNDLWAKSCKECHPDNKIVSPGASFFHQPFLKHDCNVCHGGEEVSSNEKSLSKAVKWENKHVFRGGKAYILLPTTVKSYDIAFEAPSLDFQKILSYSNASALPEDIEPVIEKVSLCNWEKYPWTEAGICVKTSIPCRVRIVCNGVSGSTSDENYYTYQIVPLAHAKINDFYSCKIEAQTYDGQIAAKNFKFKAVEVSKAKDSFAKTVAVNIYRSPLDEPILEIQADGQLTWRIGLLPKSNIKISNKPKDHPLIKSISWTSTNACYNCHSKNKLGVIHPVGVPLNYKMAQRNKDLPLFNGVISCATCHYPHASSNSYFLRKTGKNLCLSCHNK
ncbi:cytochrome c3 family protein [Thermodesulfatator indicus]